jgi:hypothetical protein
VLIDDPDVIYAGNQIVNHEAHEDRETKQKTVSWPFFVSFAGFVVITPCRY